MVDDASHESGGLPAEALIRRARSGDAHALDMVLRTVESRVRRWARAWIDSPDDADDVAQAALVAAARGIAAFDGRSRLDTWLHRIARRCAADWYRTRRRGQRLRQRHAEADAQQVPEWDVDQMDRARVVGTIRDRFRSLPLRQREVFDLVDLQGCTADEAAALLGIEAVTVRVHLMRARRTLRTWILEQHPELVEDENAVH